MSQPITGRVRITPRLGSPRAMSLRVQESSAPPIAGCCAAAAAALERAAAGVVGCRRGRVDVRNPTRQPAGFKDLDVGAEAEEPAF